MAEVHRELLRPGEFLDNSSLSRRAKMERRTCVLCGNSAGYLRGELVQFVEVQGDFDRMDARLRDEAAFLLEYSIFSLFAAQFIARRNGDVSESQSIHKPRERG